MKIVLQDGRKDCGVCCLLSIIRFYGGEVPKEILRELTNTTKDGVSLYNLLEASKKLGFDAEGLEGKLEDIEINNLPCIAHIEVKKRYRHFIVIYKINTKKKEVTIMDPAKGKKVISFSEFHLLSSNYYLFLKPKKKIPILKKKNIIYKKIKTQIKQNKKLIFFIIILTSNCFILNIFTSFHFKLLLEYAIEYQISNNLLIISIILCSTFLLKNIMNYLRDILFHKWNCLFTIEITTLTYKQILTLPYLYFKNRTTGEVLSRFQDLNIIRDFLANFFTTITIDLFCVIIFFLLIEKYEKKLGIIVLIMMILFLILILLFRNQKRSKIKKVKQEEDIMNSYLIQGISNVDTIKGSHLEKRFTDKFELNTKSFQEKVYNYYTLLEKSNFLEQNGKDLLQIILYGVGSYFVINQSLTLTNFIMIQSFLSYLMNSYTNILYLVSNYHSYKLTLERVEEIFMLDQEEFQNSYFYLPYTLEGDIIIKNLNYKISSKEIFNNLNVVIKKGEKILLSGPSGCGKSTLMKFLMKYIDTPYGTIQISGIDINHYHLQNIRENITYITNNEYLFQDTLRNNICLYKEYDEEQIKKVCEICLVEDLIKSKNITLETVIEENGFDLSSGERQRIILARSILRKSNIYILDEALGQIDIYQEKKILKNIFTYLQDKTIIVISHRFHNKKEFDRVLKIEEGTICEEKAL